MLHGSRSSILVDPRFRFTRHVVQLAAAELKRHRKILLLPRGIKPDARATEARFKALNADNSEDEPEEADEKRNIN